MRLSTHTAQEAVKVAHDDFVDTAARYLNPAMPTTTHEEPIRTRPMSWRSWTQPSRR